MKTAISIPDPTFLAAESLAQRLGISRSQLYTIAVTEYLKAQGGQGVTEKLDQVYATRGSGLDQDYAELQASSLTDNNQDDW